MLADSLGSAPTPLPWLWRAAARFAGEDPDALGGDAGAVTRSLSHAVDLFALPAVCTSFDTAREAEALGCDVAPDGAVEGFVTDPDDAFDVDITAVVEDGRVPVTLDATERLVAAVDVDVLAGITGPATLTRHLLDGPVADHDVDTVEEALFTATDVCVELVNAHLDRDADGVALLEPDGVGDLDAYVDIATPIANVIDHYETAGVVVTERADHDTITAVGALGLDAVTGGVDAPGDAIAAGADAGVTVGVGVPGDVFLDGPDALEDFVGALPSDALVSSAWTVPEAVDPEALHGLMGSL